MFGSSFVSQYGDAPNRTWVSGLAKLSDEQIINGLQRLVDEPREFPPNLSQFLALCRQPAQSRDGVTHAAMHRALPLDPPETAEHREARKARGREEMAALKAKLRGKA